MPLGGVERVQKAIDHAIEHKIINDNKLFSDLKNNGSNMKKIYEDLHSNCVNHHRRKIDMSLKDLGNNRTVSIDHHVFHDSTAYLKYLKENHNHSFMPIDHINKHLQHIDHQNEKEMHKDLHLNKSISGPCL